MKKVIVIIFIAVATLLAWAPWVNNQSVHDWALQNRGKIDGTIDKNGNLLCDYNVQWMPFGRYVVSCEGGYYRPFWLLGYKKDQPEIDNQVGISAKECVAKSGEIVNILNDKRADDLAFHRDHKPEFCNNASDYLGDVTGLRCPCICCKK